MKVTLYILVGVPIVSCPASVVIPCLPCGSMSSTSIEDYPELHPPNLNPTTSHNHQSASCTYIYVCSPDFPVCLSSFSQMQRMRLGIRPVISMILRFAMHLGQSTPARHFPTPQKSYVCILHIYSPPDARGVSFVLVVTLMCAFLLLKVLLI